LTNPSSLLSNIKKKDGKMGNYASAVLKNHSFHWPSTQNVVANLLPIIPHLSPLQLINLSNAAWFKSFQMIFGTILRHCAVKVAGFVFTTYSLDIDAQIYANQSIIKTYSLCLTLISYIYPIELNICEVILYLTRGLLHLDQNVRESSAKSLGHLVNNDQLYHINEIMGQNGSNQHQIGSKVQNGPQNGQNQHYRVGGLLGGLYGFNTVSVSSLVLNAITSTFLDLPMLEYHQNCRFSVKSCGYYCKVVHFVLKCVKWC
jgi:hypothetical protein